MNHRFCLIYLILLCFAAGCSQGQLEVRTQNQPGVRKQSQPEIKITPPQPSLPFGFQTISPSQLYWVDDGPAGVLHTAIVRSICYYQRLPKTKVFTLAQGKQRSPRQMVSSLRLFWQAFTQAQNPQELTAALESRFLVYESISDEHTNGLFTGYYEPEIAASQKPTGRLNTPVYTRPKDLVMINLRAFPGNMPSRTLAGRLKKGILHPYETRREIAQSKTLHKRAKIIAYVDQIDLFFLQIQGSGILRFANGKRIKIGYAASNGHPYRSLGGVMVRRGLLTRKEVTLQSIRQYLKNNPSQVSSLLFTNPSYVFFAQRNAFAQPIGNLGLPLIPGRSVAIDQTTLPAGGLLYISTVLPNANNQREQPLNRFVLAHDTGGAIQGHGRIDIFFGRGKEVEPIAGRLKHPGRLFLLLGREVWLDKAPKTPTCTASAKQAIRMAKHPGPSALKIKQSSKNKKRVAPKRPSTTTRATTPRTKAKNQGVQTRIKLR